ncbi:VOC family protein [Lysinibacillus yapensis]|uniref:VOC family protein n=1 Tax=Ureibacillus yapensis TaxID=2304605 RepID=A0A396S5T7_9BACL|nr:VOC family protein [Lysinibacillus yapensis]RHW35857.1 VOC family protein [Lysinibacillus yapensis]
MIERIGQVMLYVDDQEKAVKFWTEKVGFQLRSEHNGDGMQWFEIAPNEDAQTTFVLHNKEFVAKMSPELNLGTPSIMFYVENLENLYGNLKEKNVTVGEIVQIPGGKVFNFADDEGQYFAVMEKA